MKKKIAIFTMFWGPVYADMYRKYLLPSLMQEGNLPRLTSEGYRIRWHVYSDVKPPEHPELIHHQTTDTITANCMREFINENLDAICFMIFPDIFVGNNSIYNAVKMIENKPGISLCVAHPRISLEKLEGRNIEAKTNAELVNLAFDYAHKCLWGANNEEDTNMTWGGISWNKIDEKNYAVIHNLATPFAYQFQPGDAEFVCIEHGGCLDRDFVAKKQREGRIKICGSSDLCFFVEITTDKHDQPLYPGQKYNDKPGHGEENSMYWNDVICNWRKA